MWLAKVCDAIHTCRNRAELTQEQLAEWADQNPKYLGVIDAAPGKLNLIASKTGRDASIATH